MCSRHEYPRLEMRLFKFPLDTSLSGGVVLKAPKTLARIWRLESGRNLCVENKLATLMAGLLVPLRSNKTNHHSIL